MKAAILYGERDFRIEEKPSPSIKEDEYLVQVKTCGVCHSELPQWKQKMHGLEYPRFIGHESAGEIIDIGKKTEKFDIGDRVAVWVDGKGFAERLAVKEDRVYKIADGISYEEALAEPIGCSTNGIIKAGIELGDSVALIGAGFMGLIMLQLLKLRGVSHIFAVDVRQEALELAGEMGADTLINPNDTDAVKEVFEKTGGKGVDVAIEAGGVQPTLDMAASVCRMEGKLLIFGFHQGERKINDLGFWNWMAFDIINGHFRNLDTILGGTRIGMDLLNRGQLSMKKLVTHSYPMEEINKAFEAAEIKPEGFVKSVVTM